MNELINNRIIEQIDSGVDVIYKEIRDRICTRFYEKGTILKETDIAEEFNVSRTPIREVFQRLKLDGLVEAKKKLGTTVIGLDSDALREKYDVRIALLDYIARESDVQFNAKHIAVMDEILLKVPLLIKHENVNEYWKLNDTLQGNLCSVIQNKYLKNLSTQLYLQTARYWAYYLPHNWEFSCNILQREVEQERDLMLVENRVGVFCTLKSFTILSKAKCDAIEAELQR